MNYTFNLNGIVKILCYLSIAQEASGLVLSIFKMNETTDLLPLFWENFLNTLQGKLFLVGSCFVQKFVFSEIFKSFWEPL